MTKCDQIVYSETVSELPGASLKQDPHAREIMDRKEQAIKDAAAWKGELRRLEKYQKGA